MNQLAQHADIVIVGGGPVGALAALRFAREGRRVTLIEARAKDARVQDARALALSWYSQQQLAAVGAWPDSLPATLIDTVHVSQQGAWGRTVLNRADLALPHLGVVVDYPVLTTAINQQLEQAGVNVRWDTRVTAVKSLHHYATVSTCGPEGEDWLTCRLVVLAEGGALADTLPGVKRLVHDYRQSAVLATITTEKPHDGVAYERFSHQGPFALLPHGDGFMLVWTRSHDDAQTLQTLDDAAVIAQLQQAFGDRQGKILSVGPRAVFPLALRQVNRVVSGRVVLIGNAAQTMHPVAAQGLNLGLRDAIGLTDALVGVPDAGEPRVLAAYAAARKVDSHAVVGFTHGLIQLFDGHSALVSTLRGVGMNLLDVVPPLRRKFATHLVFGV